jgi:hypothetical protein
MENISILYIGLGPKFSFSLKPAQPTFLSLLPLWPPGQITRIWSPTKQSSSFQKVSIPYRILSLKSWFIVGLSQDFRGVHLGYV